MRLVRDTLCWPSIHHDIKYLCDNCSICQEAKLDQPRETMQSQPIPKRRCQTVSTDLFNVKKDVYLVVVDNLTKYWDLKQRNRTVVSTFIVFFMNRRKLSCFPTAENCFILNATAIKPDQIRDSGVSRKS